MLLAQKEVSRGGRGANGRECDDMRIGPIPLYNIFYSRNNIRVEEVKETEEIEEPTFTDVLVGLAEFLPNDEDNRLEHCYKLT